MESIRIKRKRKPNNQMNKQSEQTPSMLTFPSMTATHEFVVPKSIPITSLPAGFALHRRGNAHLQHTRRNSK